MTDISAMKRKYRTPQQAEFPDELFVRLRKFAPLRYGENPNQAGATYVIDIEGESPLVPLELVKSGKGGWSAINFMDVVRALDILKYFNAPSWAVMKHCVPSGFATMVNGLEPFEVYEAARDADKRSAFGSVVVTNVSIDKVTAEAILSTYVEAVAAPEFEQGVMPMFDAKKDMRVIKFSNLHNLPRFDGDDVKFGFNLIGLPGGYVLAEQPYLTSIRSASDLITDGMVMQENVRYQVNRNPTPRELQDMLTAWYVNFGVRSNGIVLLRNGITLAVGSGQQERVGAIEQAIAKAVDKCYDWSRHAKTSTEYPLSGAVCSSDGFFPFRDSIDLLSEQNVSAVVQPGGSLRDYEVIHAANERGMSMAFTLERCFGHF